MNTAFAWGVKGIFIDDGTRGAEQIVAAAIRNGESVWTLPAPARHGCVIREFGRDATIAGEQGFVTSRMRFVTRWQALRIAAAGGQVAHSLLRRGDSELYSEDVW